MNNTLIDFIGIGVGKAGTTTVAKLLETHPQVGLSVPKEVQYFNSYTGYEFGNKKNKNRDKTSDWYFQHFAQIPPGCLKGEFSPVYFIDPDAPKNIYEVFPDVKIICCLRNPVDRAYSHYQMAKNYGQQEKRTFSEAIRGEGEYIEKGLYHKHLTRYLDYFDRQQIRVITFEEIKKEPLVTIQKLFEYLEVSSDFEPENITLRANAPLQVRSRVLSYLENKITRTLAGSGLGSTVQRLKNISWLRKLYTRPYEYPPMNTEDRLWLKAQFIEDIEALEHLLQKDFSEWK